jgi:SET family sugar efflux transporter-like MFS transporter
MAVKFPFRRLLPLALIFTVVGLASSFVYPYFGLFLTEAVGAGPVHTTAFLLAAPVSSVAMAWVVGRLSDSRPIRWHLLLTAALAGVAGTALTAVVRDYWVLLAVTVTLAAVAGSLFAQSFAYARQIMQGSDPSRAALGISTLRTLFSVAWVGGPPLAALVLAARGFGWTYGLAAIMYGITALVVLLWLPRMPAPAVTATTKAGGSGPLVRRGPLFAIIASVALVQTAATLNVSAMPLFVTADLDGSLRTTGLILGLCAALEIPLMIGFGALATRVPIHRLLVCGVVCGIGYHGVAAAATAVWMLAAAQVLQAVVIATVGALSITYVQDLMPDQPGRATTMVSNTFPIGQVLAAPLFGLAQHFGFRLAYGLNLALCALALILLLAGTRRPTGAAAHPAGATATSGAGW